MKSSRSTPISNFDLPATCVLPLQSWLIVMYAPTPPCLSLPLSVFAVFLSEKEAANASSGSEEDGSGSSSSGEEGSGSSSEDDE